MKERYVINIILVVSMILAYFSGYTFLYFVPFGVSFILVGLKMIPYKPTKRLYWRLFFRRSVTEMITSSLPITIQYPMIIWVELGDCEEAFVNNKYSKFVDIVSNKSLEISRRLAFKEPSYDPYFDYSDLEDEELEFINKIENGK